MGFPPWLGPAGGLCARPGTVWTETVTSAGRTTAVPRGVGRIAPRVCRVTRTRPSIKEPKPTIPEPLPNGRAPEPSPEFWRPRPWWEPFTAVGRRLPFPSPCPNPCPNPCQRVRKTGREEPGGLQWVVRAGVVTVTQLMNGTAYHPDYPGVYGFSVQSAPLKTIDELAKGGDSRISK